MEGIDIVNVMLATDSNYKSRYIKWREKKLGMVNGRMIDNELVIIVRLNTLLVYCVLVPSIPTFSIYSFILPRRIFVLNNQHNLNVLIFLPSPSMSKLSGRYHCTALHRCLTKK